MAEKKEAKEVKAPKKTKAAVKQEIKEEIANDESKTSRTERTRAEKAARREAKAERKAANVVEEKKKKMSNGLIALLIFGVLIAMFAAVWGYNYSQKEKSIESYLEKNGGKDVYSSIQLEENKTASITAEKNHMKMTINVKADDADKQIKYYKGKNGETEMKYMASYFLTTIKPSVRGFGAKTTLTVKVNDKKVKSITVSYREAKKVMKSYTQ